MSLKILLEALQHDRFQREWILLMAEADIGSPWPHQRHHLFGMPFVDLRLIRGM